MAIAAIGVIGGSAGVYALNRPSEVQDDKVNTVARVEPKEVAESATAPVVEPPTKAVEPQVTETVEEPAPIEAPAPEAPARPDYLHPSLKKKLSESDKQKTWECFNLAVNHIASRNSGFDNVDLIAQVSRNLQNPCSPTGSSYDPDGRHIASYVEWCINRARGDSVPPIVAEHVADAMCSGY